MAKRRSAPWAVVCLFLAGCATLETDWNTARSEDTVPAYEVFLQEHSEGDRAEWVRTRIREMEQDISAWQDTLALNTVDGYRKFLDERPDSPFAEKVEGKIVDVEVSDMVAGGYLEAPPIRRLTVSLGRKYSVINVFNNTRLNLVIRCSGRESFKLVFTAMERGQVEVRNGMYTLVASVETAQIRSYVNQQRFDGGDYKLEYYIETDLSPVASRLPRVLVGRPGEITWPVKRPVPDYLK